MTWIYNATPEVENASKYPAVIGVSVAFCGLMLLVVTVRGVFRRTVLGWDDHVIFTTALFSLTYTVMCVVQTRWGLGLPVSSRPEEDMHTFKVLSYAGKPWYQLTLAGYKLALCLGYLRIIGGANLYGFRIATIAIAVSAVAVQVVFVLLNFFACMPIAKSFDPKLPGHCLPFQQTQYPMAAVSIMYDIVIFLLPIPLLLQLQMDRRSVLGLCVLFGCGIITTVCSIVRAVYLQDVGPTGNGDNTMVVLLGTVEANVGIVMSCLPFLRALFRNLITHTNRTIRGYQSDRSRPSEVDDKTSRSYAMGAVTGSHGPQHLATVEKGRIVRRSGSEEAILHEKSDAIPDDGILRTTQYEVREEWVSVNS